MPRKLDLPLPTADSLFSTQEERDGAEQEYSHGKDEWLEDVPLSLIDDHPQHMFGVRMDADMEGTISSVAEHGVLNRAYLRPKEDGRYELISGYRRRKASELTERSILPCVVKRMSDDEAVILMFNSNAHRSIILPSEKASGYKIALPAMDRQGQRTDLTSSVLPTKLEKGIRTAELVGAPYGDGKDAVYQYIELNKLIPELLQMVDNKVLKLKDVPKMGLYPAEQLAQLPENVQSWVLDAILLNDCTPSHDQTIRMVKEFEIAQSKGEQLTSEVIYTIMQEEKPNQKEKRNIKLPKEIIERFFKPDTPPEKILERIEQALELLQKSRTPPLPSNNHNSHGGRG